MLCLSYNHVSSTSVKKFPILAPEEKKFRSARMGMNSPSASTGRKKSQCWNTGAKISKCTQHHQKLLQEQVPATEIALIKYMQQTPFSAQFCFD
jgi:hypothetical protein